jgi:NAD(P)-dependent dehydrogenase (short-subunit alcohol dehydrogenase family)
MLFTLTRMMALEFAPAVRVNAIAPGLILPPPGKDVSYLKNLASTNPLHRIGSLKGITDAVLFLVRSVFVTGQVIFVDGGYHMRGSVYG